MKNTTLVILESALQQVAKYANEEWMTDSFAKAILANGAESLFAPTFEVQVFEMCDDGVQREKAVKVSGLATMHDDPMRGVVTVKGIFRQIVRDCDYRISAFEKAQERAARAGVIVPLQPNQPDARGCTEGSEDNAPEIVQVLPADAYEAVASLHDLLDEYYQMFTESAFGTSEPLPYHSVEVQGTWDDIHDFEEARQHLARAREQRKAKRRSKASASILAMGMKSA